MDEKEVKKRISDIVFRALHDDTSEEELTEEIWSELQKLKEG
jgi:hypothetical protein